MVVPVPARYTAAEVANHNSFSDCWVSLRGKVYDVTSFLQQHPGGPQALAQQGRAGADVTAAFEQKNHSATAHAILKSLYLGELEDEHQPAPLLASANQGSMLNKSNTRTNLHQILGHPYQDGGNLEETMGGSFRLDDSGCKWHAMRRAAILEAHPEISDLMTPEPKTVVWIVFITVLHCLGCLAAQWTDSFVAAALMAYTLGAFCKMYQFGMAHELCHGNVAHALERYKGSKAFLMHLCAVPACNNLVHDYYTWMHLGHHSLFGSLDIRATLRDVLLDQHLDGDLISVNVMKLVVKGLFTNMRGSWRVGAFLAAFHRAPYVRLLIFDNSIHLLHGISCLTYSCFCGIGFILLAPLLILFPHRIRQILRDGHGPGGSIESQPLSDDEASSMLSIMWHITGHFWCWFTIDILLIWAGPRTSHAIHLACAYLFLSELFYSGFLFHPYMAFWLGTHGTGSGDFDVKDVEPSRGQHEVKPSMPSISCQPTMSTYSWMFAAATANLTYHVEHHDFPKCPWTKLPQITALAPEFYLKLRRSRGFFHTLQQYLQHGHSWRYGCLD